MSAPRKLGHRCEGCRLMARLKHYDPGNEGRYAYNPRNTYKRVNSEI